MTATGLALTATAARSQMAFARTAGAELVAGNAVRLLWDAADNYPCWLEAIAAAKRQVHFETYFLRDDEVGRQFGAALRERAEAGVKVRLLYDWLGVAGKTPRKLFRELAAAGVELRCFNPPKLDQPLGFFRRDHRKVVICDEEVAYVTGLCVSAMWCGDQKKGVDPWRDTGVELRGPAVREVAMAFASSWALTGPPLPDDALPGEPPPARGEVPVRVVATSPGTADLYRLDLLIAAGARKNLWLTDAYFAGTSAYTEALAAAARDGVDVRLLVPGRGSDIAAVQAISRVGYRPLLEAGVRVFEWNGAMIHAKSAVADSTWARIGSTNLNIASWIGNWELDVVIEHAETAKEVEAKYLKDLENSTEIVLERHTRVRTVHGRKPRRIRGAGGTAARAAGAAVRYGRVLRSAMTREHGPTEAKLMAQAGILLCVIAGLTFKWPHLLGWPTALLGLWIGITLVIGAWRARGRRRT